MRARYAGQAHEFVRMSECGIVIIIVVLRCIAPLGGECVTGQDGLGYLRGLKLTHTTAAYTSPPQKPRETAIRKAVIIPDLFYDAIFVNAKARVGNFQALIIILMIIINIKIDV